MSATAADTIGAPKVHRRAFPRARPTLATGLLLAAGTFPSSTYEDILDEPGYIEGQVIWEPPTGVGTVHRYEAASWNGVSPSSRTSPSSRRTAADLAYITDVAFTDINLDPYIIGGSVTWNPPQALNGWERYTVFVSYDEYGLYKAPLVDNFNYEDRIPVGTNSLYMYEESSRMTMQSGWRANWLMVYAWSSAEGYQPTSDAAKLPLFDQTDGVVPAVPAMSSFAFADTDADAGEIGGTLEWAWADPADHGFAELYEVFLASDADGSGMGNRLPIPRGTNQATFPADTSIGSSPGTFPWTHFVLYAYSSYGRSSSAAALAICDVGGSCDGDTATTTAVTKAAATTVTATTTPPDASALVSDVAYADVNPDPYTLDGLVTWTPPSDVSDITYYGVFIAYDPYNSYGAQMWDLDLGDMWVPVGTNYMTVWENTQRRLTDKNYPANWMIVFPYGSGGLHPTNVAGKLRLYDNQPDLPPTPPFSSFTFLDTDGDGGEIGGLVQFTPTEGADFGFIQTLEVFVAEDTSGTNSELIHSFAWGTNQLVLQADYPILTRDTMLLYSSNPNGRSNAALSIESIDAVQADTSTTTTAAGYANSVSNLVFIDTEPDANLLSGFVTFSPPTDVTNVLSYHVFIAYDELNTYGAALWSIDADDRVHVGTNQMEIYEQTPRGTMDPNFPANYLLVFVYKSDLGMQLASDATAIPLFDYSEQVPPRVSLDTITFTDTDTQSGIVTGTLQWTLPDNADLALMTEWAVYMAESTSGLNQELIGGVYRGTNELALSDFSMGSATYLLVYAKNPSGLSSTADSLALVDQVPPTTTSSATSVTGTSTTTATATSNRFRCTLSASSNFDAFKA